MQQQQTPLLDVIQQCGDRPQAAFYVPGHKHGRGTSTKLAQLLGKQALRSDVPELPEVGNCFPPEGPMREAQALAAELFGADRTWFLANGSTSGIIAAILATCSPGDALILPRNAHRAAIAGLVLSGAVPVFVAPEYDPDWDVLLAPTPEAIEAAIASHPKAKAVSLVYPTYQGICGNLAAIAQVANRYNLPLLVDEAHGAHFAFHEAFPPSSLSLGADVVVQSTHKTLGALTQASMLHLQGDRVEAARLSAALQLVQSSSPNHLLFAALDAARQQMALEGRSLWQEALGLADAARRRLAAIPGVRVFGVEQLPTGRGMSCDRARLTVNVAGLGWSGLEVDELLHDRFGVTAELPTAQNLTFVVTFGNRVEEIDRLVEGFATLSREVTPSERAIAPLPELPPLPPALSPRDAFFAPTEIVSRDRACGRISAELVCPYPPGIPVLLPGETILPASLDYLQQVLALGKYVAIDGCRDPTLQTFVAVAD